MKRELIPQIREQMSGPDRLKFLAQNNPGFFHFIEVKKTLKTFYRKGIMQLSNADARAISKIFKFF